MKLVQRLHGAIVLWTHEKAIRVGSAFRAGSFVLLEKHDLKQPVAFGLAFLAGACVFWKKHDQEKIPQRFETLGYMQGNGRRGDGDARSKCADLV